MLLSVLYRFRLLYGISLLNQRIFQDQDLKPIFKILYRFARDGQVTESRIGAADSPCTCCGQGCCNGSHRFFEIENKPGAHLQLLPLSFFGSFEIFRDLMGTQSVGRIVAVLIFHEEVWFNRSYLALYKLLISAKHGAPRQAAAQNLVAYNKQMVLPMPIVGVLLLGSDVCNRRLVGEHAS